MKVAIPLSSGELSSHFGHCEAFAVYSIEEGKVTHKETLSAPIHEHGSHPSFLHSLDVKAVICGGMGQGAQDLMREYGIEIFSAQAGIDLDEQIALFISHKLQKGAQSCGHHHQHEE